MSQCLVNCSTNQRNLNKIIKMSGLQGSILSIIGKTQDFFSTDIDIVTIESPQNGGS